MRSRAPFNAAISAGPRTTEVMKTATGCPAADEWRAVDHAMGTDALADREFQKTSDPAAEIAPFT